MCKPLRDRTNEFAFPVETCKFKLNCVQVFRSALVSVMLCRVAGFQVKNSRGGKMPNHVLLQRPASPLKRIDAPTSTLKLSKYACGLCRMKRACSVHVVCV